MVELFHHPLYPLLPHNINLEYFLFLVNSLPKNSEKWLGFASFLVDELDVVGARLSQYFNDITFGITALVGVVNVQPRLHISLSHLNLNLEKHSLMFLTRTSITS